ncbi:TPA: hypothetical protein EYO57_24580 [Candidatus Poribacteria bacterium]|nr:hypothetical protein [Candidatus Poribacteria bacterium]HIC01907.1 hypothetical protein [Candidatus Poribacteria bacterium]
MCCSHAAYYGMINFIDDQVGHLIQYAGGLKNCLTVFTSNHGEMLGDHNLFRKTWPQKESVHYAIADNWRFWTKTLHRSGKYCSTIAKIKRPNYRPKNFVDSLRE